LIVTIHTTVKMTIPSSIDPLKSSVYGSGMIGVSAGYRGSFFVQAVDTFGNLIPFGGQKITAIFEQRYFVPEGMTLEAAKNLVFDVDSGGPGTYQVRLREPHNSLLSLHLSSFSTFMLSFSS
jgi:hypothetical protein